MAAASPKLHAQGASPQNGAAPVTLEEITVTGERTDRSLRNTTSSVTVLGPQEIERRSGARNVAEALEGVPNATPRGSSELPAIRGIQSSSAGGVGVSSITGSLPRAPLIVDDIGRPTSLQPFSFLGFYDLRQIEVLRGPQTTFRGRSAIGGAFVVRTNDPVFFNEYGVRTGVSFAPGYGAPNVTAAGMANMVLAPDLAAARVVIERQNTSDYRRVLYPNGVLDRDSGLADGDLTALRGKLLLTPMGVEGPLTIKLLGDYSKGRVPQLRDAVTGPGALGFPFRARVTPSVGQGYQRIYNVDAQVYGADVDYRLADGSRLRSISSFAGERSRSTGDQTENLRFNVDEQALNQDFLYSFGSPRDRFSGLVGLSFNERRQDARVDSVVPAIRRSALDTRSSSQALFADLRLGLTGDVDLLFGGRLNRNEDKRDQTVAQLLPGPTPFRALASARTETLFLPKVGLSWRIDDRQTLSVTAREGYNPGGSSLNLATGAPFTFDSERVWTFETTYRGSILDGALSFGATAFYNLHRDPQVYVQAIAGNRFSLQVVNVPRGISYGAEFDVTAKLHDTLRLRLGLGLLRTEVTAAPIAQPDFKGNRFGLDPSITPSAGIVWTPIERLSIDASIAYVSRYFSDVTNAAIERAGNYALVDVGTSYRFSGNLTGRAFVKNATDAAGLTRKISNTNADITPPRTFGLLLDARF